MNENDFPIPSNWVDVTPPESGCPVFSVELTDEENMIREQSVADAIAFEQSLIDRKNAQESAMNKLAKLGLTIEEAKAVIGLT